MAATTQSGAACPAPFSAARVGLPHEYVGGVLVGAAQEADRVGPGTATFGWAAVHAVDSSWEMFRVLAVGVVRLLSIGPVVDVPPDLLPCFGATAPEPPGLG